ncbi:hypothetical protein ZIOFF_067210 [Zingiber officinale]|uniref:Uncharacterized protein n=1 Tax=Zingiber officinale TaxID=94328 RepID=A0A8J5EVE5_ZINOF|nr:hypothetical protein ZIOFF_067210 [Zingiber officinale]
MGSKKRVPGLSRLRRVIEKVKFLLSFDATRWMVSSFKRSSPPAAELRFKTPPSLLDCSDDYYDARSSSSFVLSRTSSSLLSSPELQAEMSRSTSEASPSWSPGGGSGEDVNLRADRFIERFHRQLLMERQVSLELRANGQGLDVDLWPTGAGGASTPFLNCSSCLLPGFYFMVAPTPLPALSAPQLDIALQHISATFQTLFKIFSAMLSPQSDARQNATVSPYSFDLQTVYSDEQ